MWEQLDAVHRKELCFTEVVIFLSLCLFQWDNNLYYNPSTMLDSMMVKVEPRFHLHHGLLCPPLIMGEAVGM